MIDLWFVLIRVTFDLLMPRKKNPTQWFRAVPKRVDKNWKTGRKGASAEFETEQKRRDNSYNKESDF
jgi:hypothetical protein